MPGDFDSEIQIMKVCATGEICHAGVIRPVFLDTVTYGGVLEEVGYTLYM